MISGSHMPVHICVCVSPSHIFACVHTHTHRLQRQLSVSAPHKWRHTSILTLFCFFFFNPHWTMSLGIHSSGNGGMWLMPFHFRIRWKHQLIPAFPWSRTRLFPTFSSTKNAMGECSCTRLIFANMGWLFHRSERCPGFCFPGLYDEGWTDIRPLCLYSHSGLSILPHSNSILFSGFL